MRGWDQFGVVVVRLVDRERDASSAPHKRAILCHFEPNESRPRTAENERYKHRRGKVNSYPESLDSPDSRRR